MNMHAHGALTERSWRTPIGKGREGKGRELEGKSASLPSTTSSSYVPADLADGVVEQ